MTDSFGRANTPPPPDTPGATCACGAYYLDYPDGHVAHDVVHGHRPMHPQTGGGAEPSTPSQQGTDGRNLAPAGGDAQQVNTAPPSHKEDRPALEGSGAMRAGEPAIPEKEDMASTSSRRPAYGRDPTTESEQDDVSDEEGK